MAKAKHKAFSGGFVVRTLFLSDEVELGVKFIWFLHSNGEFSKTLQTSIFFSEAEMVLFGMNYKSSPIYLTERVGEQSEGRNGRKLTFIKH